MNDDKIRQIDASYKPFPTFKEWGASRLPDLSRWNRYSKQLKEKQENTTPEMLKEAQDLVRRAAAVDTGAIEGLYETDRGFTFTVATQAAIWRTYVEEQKGEEVRDYIEAQLDAYEYILDIAKGKNPLTEAAIRELHEIMCRNQETYSVMTNVGPQQRALPKGKYKSNSNHVRTRTGETHAYAPVDMTPLEMQRMIDEMRTKEFENAHCVLQASYAHYAFVLIHPFADGNGRVARALASIFTYKSESVPLLILNEKRDDYLDSLSEADSGDNRAFIDFVHNQALNSIQLFSESIQSASKPVIGSVLQELANLYKTESGFSYQQIDEGGSKLSQEIKREFSTLFAEEFDNSIAYNVSTELSAGNQATLDRFPNYRFSINGNCLQVVIKLNTQKLFKNVSSEFRLFLLIPRNASLDDDILLVNIENEVVFQVRISEVVPQISGVSMMRISIFVNSQVSEMLSQLNEKAQQNNGDL